MSFRQYLILMVIPAILGWLTWGFILIGISPSESGLGIFFLFYVSLAVALACTLSIFGLIFRMLLMPKRAEASVYARKAFRQAILLAILSVGLLHFQSKKILSWWTIGLSVAVLTMAEFFLISYKAKSKS